MPSVLVVLIFAIQFLPGEAQFTIERPDPYKKWTHEITLGAGMEVKWDGDDRDYLVMQMSAPTRGYLGIGFSPSGGMAGADIVLGWVDYRGIPRILDCHAFTQGPPIPDLQDDYELISAEETNNRTTIGFRRRWDTCDYENDMRIGNDTVRLIWSYHSEDPVPGPGLYRYYHGLITRGVRSVLMRTRSGNNRFGLGSPYAFTAGDRNVQTWEIAMRNVRITGRSSRHICKIVKFPKLGNKFHVIGFRPTFTPENRERVRRISLFVCQLPIQFGNPMNLFESYIQMPEQECYSQFTPMDWQQYCSTFLFSLGIGSDGEMLPSHVGIPLGQQFGYANYLKIEILYDNPINRAFVDSSGLQVYYTENLRGYDASTLFLGHRVTPFQMIPQSQNDFTTYSFCSRECTQRGISSSTGLKIISVLLNGHLTTTNIRLRHIRNGRELAPISEDNRYDSKYQQFRNLPNEVNVLPGDELIVECNYNTSMREKLTFGGFSPDDVMCQAIVLYYPRTNLTDCRSQPELYSFFNPFGITNVSGELLTKFHLPYGETYLTLEPKRNFYGGESDEYIPPDNSFQMIGGGEKELENPFDFLQITSPFHRNGMSVGEYFRKINWKDEKLVRRLENSWKNGFHYMFCSQDFQRGIPLQNDRIVKFPTYEKYQQVTRPECRVGNRRSDGPPRIEISSLIVFIHIGSLVFIVL